MNNYKVTVTREDQYEVQIDENIWTKAARDEFAKTFWNLESTEEMARKIGETLLMSGLGKFYEGWGYLKTVYEDGTSYPQGKWVGGEYQQMIPSDWTEGITVKILNTEYYETEIEV